MSCPSCQTIGEYRMQCLPCCARLVASTAPDKARASSMLEVIARYRDAPTRTEILAEVTRMRETPQGALL